jgi:transporter family-2 protein
MPYAALLSLALSMGVLLAVYLPVLSQSGRIVGSPILASIINFVVGLLALVLLAIVGGSRLTPAGLAAVPAWAWLAGLLGAGYVAATTVLGPRLGAAVLLALVLCGQMAAALLVDHYGAIGFPRNPVTAVRLIGAALLVVGVLLIMRR